MAEYHETLLQVRPLLDAGNFYDAFVTLRPLLCYPGMIQQTGELAEVLAVFADISVDIVGDKFAATVREAAQKPTDASALYRLGYELIEYNLSDISATILAHAHNLYPKEEAILTELCVALEQNMYYAEVCHMLRAALESVQSSFLCTYLLAFNSVMSGDLATPRQLLPNLQRMSSHDARYAAMVARITGMIQRADALPGHTPLDERDLRGWHLIITAGLLLHLSPHGFDEGMNGRYAFVQDIQARCLEGIRKVQAVLDALQIGIPRIFALPDRDSQILAAATAHSLDLPLENWPEAGSEAPGLIVAYDLNTQDGKVLSTLLQHRPGQILWSHAACWISEQPVVADLTTFLYQVNHAPWGGRMVVDPETRKVKTQPPDERDPAILATEILSAMLEADSLNDLPVLINLVRAASATGENTFGLLSSSGQRQKQWAGSPVPSNYFH